MEFDDDEQDEIFHDAAEGIAAAKCADCGGTGKVQLLLTARPCATCGGTGKAGQDMPGEPFDEWGEPVPGHWVTETTFDNRDRPTRERQWFVPDKPKPKSPPTA